MEQHQLKYHNITISGTVATGTSTLLHNLKPYLKPLGWKFYSGGEFVREYCKKKGLRLEDANARGDDFTRELDRDITHRLTKEKHLIIESWLAGFDAQEIPGVLRILLECPDESVVIDRVVNRDKVTVEEAKEHIRVRTDANIAKWKRIYGDHNFWDHHYFDLIINTYSNGPTETLRMTLKVLGYKK